MLRAANSLTETASRIARVITAPSCARAVREAQHAAPHAPCRVSPSPVISFHAGVLNRQPGLELAHWMVPSIAKLRRESWVAGLVAHVAVALHVCEAGGIEPVVRSAIVARRQQAWDMSPRARPIGRHLSGRDALHARSARDATLDATARPPWRICPVSEHASPVAVLGGNGARGRCEAL